MQQHEALVRNRITTVHIYTSHENKKFILGSTSLDMNTVKLSMQKLHFFTAFLLTPRENKKDTINKSEGRIK